jgi:hypothetical protein
MHPKTETPRNRDSKELKLSTVTRSTRRSTCAAKRLTKSRRRVLALRAGCRACLEHSRWSNWRSRRSRLATTTRGTLLCRNNTRCCRRSGNLARLGCRSDNYHRCCRCGDRNNRRSGGRRNRRHCRTRRLTQLHQNLRVSSGNPNLSKPFNRSHLGGRKGQATSGASQRSRIQSGLSQPRSQLGAQNGSLNHNRRSHLRASPAYGTYHVRQTGRLHDGISRPHRLNRRKFPSLQRRLRHQASSSGWNLQGRYLIQSWQGTSAHKCSFLMAGQQSCNCNAGTHEYNRPNSYINSVSHGFSYGAENTLTTRSPLTGRTLRQTNGHGQGFCHTFFHSGQLTGEPNTHDTPIPRGGARLQPPSPVAPPYVQNVTNQP